MRSPARHWEVSAEKVRIEGSNHGECWRSTNCGMSAITTNGGALCQSGARGTGTGRKILLWNGKMMKLRSRDHYPMKRYPHYEMVSDAVGAKVLGQRI